MITTVHDSYTPFYFSSNLPNGLRLYALMSELLESVVYYFSKSENCSIYMILIPTIWTCNWMRKDSNQTQLVVTRC
jgi:hypothetical protein